MVGRAGPPSSYYCWPSLIRSLAPTATVRVPAALQKVVLHAAWQAQQAWWRCWSVHAFAHLLAVCVRHGGADKEHALFTPRASLGHAVLRMMLSMSRCIGGRRAMRGPCSEIWLQQSLTGLLSSSRKRGAWHAGLGHRSSLPETESRADVCSTTRTRRHVFAETAS